MVIYGIEEVKKNTNKKIFVYILIATIIVLAISIFISKKTIEIKYDKNKNLKTIEVNSNSEISNQDTNLTITVEEKNAKLTNEQIQKINTIYNSNEKRAFLTFDDGPSRTVTPQILDILNKENIKATFFVLGSMVKNYPDIVKRENIEGHYIANHGYSHIYGKIYANENTVLEEYNMTNKNIQEALGNTQYNSNIFRFPGGSVGGYYNDIKKKAKENMEKEGIASLDWNCLTNDADGANTKDKILQNLKSTCDGKNSIVVLLHDAANKQLTADTLPDVINYLKEQGYSFKNLYDIL